MIRILKNITLFITVFTVTLFALDLFVRYAGISQVLIYEYDSLRGRVFIENSEYLMTTEGFAMGKINEYGYIGPGYDRKRTPGKLRIALIGDSYVEGFQHFDRNHFRAVMERVLKEKYGIDAEVLNFGKFGYNLSDMYSFNKYYISQFKPDFTFFFFSEEDLSDTTTQPMMPHPHLVNDSVKIKAANIERSGRPWFLNRIGLSREFPTVMMVRNAMTLHGKGETPRILFGKFYDLLFSKNYENEISNEKHSQQISELNIKIIEDLARSRGNVLIYRDHHDLKPAFKERIEKTGIRYISLVEIFKAGNQNGIKLYFTDKNGNDGHWNIKAHELIGIYLAGWISANVK